MSEFIHQRHKDFSSLERPRELVLACAPMRSNVNISRILRAASCSGVTRVIACGRPKIDPKIARDGVSKIEFQVRRTLEPGLEQLRGEGYRLVGLEQTTDSVSMHTFAFPRRTALVIGNERTGLTEEALALLDDVVEIPVYGLPYSFNVATATAMALYEYCRQYPAG